MTLIPKQGLLNHLTRSYEGTLEEIPKKDPSDHLVKAKFTSDGARSRREPWTHHCSHRNPQLPRPQTLSWMNLSRRRIDVMSVEIDK